MGGTNTNQSPNGTNQSGDGRYQSAGGCSSKSSPKNSETSQQEIKLLPYGIKPSSSKAHGNGMCVVIANFTGAKELPGYEHDSANICQFFREVLGWKHVYEESMPSFEDEHQPLRNLSKSQFTKALSVIQKKLNDGKFDRFFLFILSHGDQYGIMTMKKGEKETDENGLPVRMKIHDIAAMFTHEKVKELKGFPKVIFNQSCRVINISYIAVCFVVFGLNI